MKRKVESSTDSLHHLLPVHFIYTMPFPYKTNKNNRYEIAKRSRPHRGDKPTRPIDNFNIIDFKKL